MDKKLEDFWDKKELKDFVNDNGFFFNMVANSISKENMEEALDDFTKNAIETNIDVPTGDNIMIFKWIASQAYKKGGKNRNGYKIDPNGWDFTNYLLNPIILLQHNAQTGGIGKAIKFDVNNDGLNILFFVDLNTLDDKTRYQVENGYISAISTGHITEEDGIEDNKTGKVYSIEDAMEKFWWENVWAAFMWGSDLYTYIVTKAQAIENSLVTIGSNEKAIALPNAIGKYALNRHAPLINKLEEMKKNAEDKKLEDVKVNEEEKVEEKVEEVTEEKTDEKVEDKVESVETNDEEKVEEEVTEEGTTEENTTEENKEDEEETTEENKEEENKEEENKEEETIEEETTEEETTEEEDQTPEDTSENKAEIAKGEEVKDNNVSENDAVAELTNQLAERDALLKKAEETITNMSNAMEDKDKLIKMANDYVISLWLSFDAEANANGDKKKTILENRIKRAE